MAALAGGGIGRHPTGTELTAFLLHRRGWCNARSAHRLGCDDLSTERLALITEDVLDYNVGLSATARHHIADLKSQ